MCAPDAIARLSDWRYNISKGSPLVYKLLAVYQQRVVSRPPAPVIELVPRREYRDANVMRPGELNRSLRALLEIF